MNLDLMIRAVQHELDVTVDGRAGPETWSAIYQRIAPTPMPAIPEEVGAVDERSERTIATLQPEVRTLARSLVHAAGAQGITIKAISGTRTFAEQDALYEQGRSKPGRIVTNARGGHSNHNFGIAFDIGIFQGGRYVPESPLYKVVGALGTGLGLEWGGNWKSIQDEPHFQLRPGWAALLPEREMLARLRALKLTPERV